MPLPSAIRTFKAKQSERYEECFKAFNDRVRHSTVKAITQKGQSIQALKALGLKDYRGNGGGTPTDSYVCQTLERAIGAWIFLVSHMLVTKVFMRPCPPRPRPGFLDSEIVKNVKDIERIWNQMKELEPKSEVIMMPFVPSEMSATLTSGLLGIGPGHEGATAGIDAFSVPVSPIRWPAAHNIGWDMARKIAKVEEHPDPEHRHAHIESVFGLGNDNYRQDVQIRAGMKAEGSGDWVPRKTHVINLVEGPVGNDPLMMIEWEATAAALKGKKDVVVWQKGGHQGTHTALHCKANGIPVVFGPEAPEKGTTLPPSAEVVDTNHDLILEYFAAGLACDLEIDKAWRSADMMLVLLHGYNPSGDQARWFGLAVAMMLRLGTAASKGEYRHYPKRRIPHKPARHVVYKESFEDYWGHRAVLGQVAKGFSNFAIWNKSYGGLAWLKCTVACGDLDAKMIKYCQKPSSDTLGVVVSAFNTCVNQAHNGGWWMNKFTPEESMHRAAAGDVQLTLGVVPGIWKFNNFLKDTANRDIIDASKARIKRSRPLAHSTWDAAKAHKKWRDKKIAEARKVALSQQAAMAKIKAKMSAEEPIVAEEGDYGLTTVQKLIKMKIKEKAAKAAYSPILGNTSSKSNFNKQSTPPAKTSKGWDVEDIDAQTVQACIAPNGNGVHVQFRKTGGKKVIHSYLKANLVTKQKEEVKKLQNFFQDGGKVYPSFHHGKSLKYRKPTSITIEKGCARLQFGGATLILAAIDFEQP